MATGYFSLWLKAAVPAVSDDYRLLSLQSLASGRCPCSLWLKATAPAVSGLGLLFLPTD